MAKEVVDDRWCNENCFGKIGLVLRIMIGWHSYLDDYCLEDIVVIKNDFQRRQICGV